MLHSSTKVSAVLVVLLTCLLGCRQQYHRPANVPSSAVWVDGAFIDCSVEQQSKANRCTVYRDRTGEILADGLFVLNTSLREAHSSELRYVAFGNRLIYLADARTLVPWAASERDPVNRVMDETLPREVLQRFWKMETSGSRLTPGGWYRAAEFFSDRPSPQPQSKVIFVVSNDCSLNTTSVTVNKAELYFYCRYFRKLNPKLQLENPSGPAPDRGPVLAGMWIPYKLALSDERWELAPSRVDMQEVKGAPEWRIDGFQTSYFLSIETAIRYLAEIRTKSTDPVIKQNADKTTAILKRLR
jgi:hypothetical protein